MPDPQPPRTLLSYARADIEFARQLRERLIAEGLDPPWHDQTHMSAGEWWDIVWNAGFRRLVAQLSQKDQERFKREHLEEVGTLRTDKGIWLDVGVLYTVGTKVKGKGGDSYEPD